jgi:hypothetical protein
MVDPGTDRREVFDKDKLVPYTCLTSKHIGIAPFLYFARSLRV